jgi:hypothetical protein
MTITLIIIVVFLIVTIMLGIFFSMKYKKQTLWIVIGMVLGGVIVRGYDFMTAAPQGRTPDPILLRQMFHLREALISYHIDYGTFPGGTNAEIVKALGGENADAKMYYDPDLMVLNEREEFVDIWNTPFQIELMPENPACPIIGSAGENGMFEGLDAPTDDFRLLGWYKDRRVGVFRYSIHDQPRD